MVMENKALICADILINHQYPSNMHAWKIVNSDNLTLNHACVCIFFAANFRWLKENTNTIF